MDPINTGRSDTGEPRESAAGAVSSAGVAGLRSTQGLERLRERVDTVVQELERLRKDNALLARRIAELEARPEVQQDQAFLVFDEEPEVLRRKVEGFIHAIDAYLTREREANE